MKLEGKCRSCKWRENVFKYNEKTGLDEIDYPCSDCTRNPLNADHYEYDETEVDDE